MTLGYDQLYHGFAWEPTSIYYGLQAGGKPPFASSEGGGVTFAARNHGTDTWSGTHEIYKRELSTGTVSLHASSGPFALAPGNGISVSSIDVGAGFEIAEWRLFDGATMLVRWTWGVPLPAPPAHRFGYDIDGSQVLVNGVAASSVVARALNSESEGPAVAGLDGTVTILFPRLRSVDGWFVALTSAGDSAYLVEWSADTTTGLDGTWQTATWHSLPSNNGDPVRPSFRIDGSASGSAQGWTTAVQDGTAYSNFNAKAIRFTVGPSAAGGQPNADVRVIHLYGFDFTPSDGTWMYVDQTTGGPEVVSVPQGDTAHFYFDATPFSGATMSNYRFAVEALTEPAGKSLADQCLVTNDPGNPVSFRAENGPESSPPTYHEVVLAAAYDADLGGPWCVRVRGEADGILPGVFYIYIDEVTAGLPQHPEIVSVLPDVNLLAGTSSVTVKARGVGSSQADRAAVLTVGDNLTTFVSDPITATSWTFIGPSVHAYDSSRRMDETHCDPDHYEITFTVPPETLGLANAYFKMVIPDLSSVEDFVTSRTTEQALSILATTFLSATSAASDTSASGEVLMRQDAVPIDFDPTNYGYDSAELLDTSLYPPTPMVQRHFHRTRAPYAVVDGLAVDPPILGAMSRSVAYARSWSPTMDLGPALGLGLMGATARWLPDTADISSGNTWHPHFGSAPNFTFSPLGTTPPYVDPAYDYYARNEKLKAVAAMIFDGTSWATFGGPSSQAGFSWVIVAVLHHPANRAHYDILASPSAATDPDRATDAALRYDNGYIRSFGGMRLSSAQLKAPSYKGRIRPVILAWAEGGKGGTLGVIDALGRHWQDYAHPNRVNYDLRMKLGQNGSVNDVSYAAEMDILDILYWDVRHTRVALSPVITKLDGVYGVTGR